MYQKKELSGKDVIHLGKEMRGYQRFIQTTAFTEENMPKYYENYNTLAKPVLSQIEKALSSNSPLCIMCSDPDNLGASLISLFLIK